MGKQNVLLTFTGYHDPYGDTSVEGQEEAGPVLAALEEGRFANAVLFATPAMAKSAHETRAAIEALHPQVGVTVVDLPLQDPTSYPDILRLLRQHFPLIHSDFPDASFFISVTSGTPQEHSSWVMLAASGEIPAKVLQVRPRRFARPGGRRVSEIDCTDPSFPEIRAPISLASDFALQTPDLSGIREQLGIIGDEPAFLNALRKAASLAEYSVNILLLGETGTGKELFAQLIHVLSGRPQSEFFPVSCPNYPETLIDSQLFGHEKGAFTDAKERRKGKFELAEGGTLFLDEIGELPVPSQSKLLRALEHGEIEPLGSEKSKKVNVRVIAATNVDVQEATESGTFRRDLYYRFRAIHIPSLRERRRDIPRIAQHALDRWNREHHQQKRLSVEALERLLRQRWPGNVRELIKVVQDSAMMVRGKIIRPDDLQFDEVLVSRDGPELPQPHEDFDINAYCGEVRRQLMETALEMAGGNKSAAARLLGVTPQAVYQYFRNRKG